MYYLTDGKVTPWVIHVALAGRADVGFAAEGDRNCDQPGGRLVRPCRSARLLSK